MDQNTKGTGIHVHISAGSITELINSVRDLYDSLIAANAPAADTAGEPVAAAAVTTAAPAGAEPPKPRGRRAKAADAAPTSGAATAAPTPAAEVKQPADVAALFSDTPAPTAPGKVTREMLREIGNAHMAEVSMAATADIIKGYGVEKISEIPEEKWPELYSKFNANLQKMRASASLLS